MKTTVRVFGVYGILLGAAISAPIPLSAQPGHGPAPVKTSKVVLGAVPQEVRLTGSVTPRRFSIIGAETAGIVDEVLVDAGDLVREGQPLARLRATPMELRMRAAQAEYEMKQAELDEMLAGSRAEDIAAERAKLQLAEANLALARADERRISELFQSQTVSQSELDRATAQRGRTEAELARQQAELDRMIKGPREEKIAAARADAASMQAEADQMKDEFERLTIRAPFNGVIGQKSTEVGQWVRQGDPVFAMAELDVLRVEVQLPEIYFSRVAVGTPVTLTFDALEGMTREEKVTARIPLASASARTFPIRVEIANDGYQLAPGMLARVALQTKDSGLAETAIIVPKDALVMSPDGTQTIWVVREGEEGKTVQPEYVKTGRSFGNQVEILGDDLKPGDDVVTRGNEMLYPGQPVAF